MAKLKYGVYVTYHYTAYNGSDCFVGEVMELDFRPNTPNGLEKIVDIIRHKKVITSKITILGLIPLSSDPKPMTDDDME